VNKIDQNRSIMISLPFHILQSAEMELSLLDPDVATLISRGDSLVLQVQKVDLERALRINTTTGELRVARTALKASSEVTKKLKEFFHYFSMSS
jgi:hypothetical protein